MLPLAILKKIRTFFRKTHLFFFKKTQFLNVFRNFTVSVAFYGKFATFGDFEKFNIFFRKTHLFFEKNPVFERFEKFHYFSRILRQICYLWRFWKKFRIFFRKTHLFFFRKTQILNVLRIFTISVAFYGKFATFGDFEKIQYFPSKNPSTFLKNPNFERFEKFYHFSRILRQICYL